MESESIKQTKTTTNSIDATTTITTSSVEQKSESKITNPLVTVATSSNLCCATTVLSSSSSPFPHQSPGESWTPLELCANASSSSIPKDCTTSNENFSIENNDNNKKEKYNKNPFFSSSSSSPTVSSAVVMSTHLANGQQSNLTSNTINTVPPSFQATNGTIANGREISSDADGSVFASLSTEATNCNCCCDSSSLDDEMMSSHDANNVIIIKNHHDKKKPCTLDFYASSGSQTKWYLPPSVGSPVTAAAAAATVSATASSTSKSSDIIKINITADMDSCLMTVSTASIAEPESSIVTPPSELSSQAEYHQYEQHQRQQDEEIMVTSEKIFPRSSVINDGVSIVGVRNGFLTNLSHQMRAVSSPSLAEIGGGEYPPHKHQRATSSNSTNTSTTTITALNNNNTTAGSASSHDDCQTTNNIVVQPAPPPAVGVLQKFKRTLTNFNKHQSTSNSTAVTNNSSITANHQQHITTTGGTTVDNNTTSSTMTMAASGSSFLMADTEMSSTTPDVSDSCSNNKYRFGPLVWRSSKERRKTKYNRRDKCNSGDSGIQIELENDEQFARVLAGNSGVGIGGGSGSGGSRINGSFNGVGFMQRKGMNSLRWRAVRRTNSAKVTSITDENVTEAINRAKILKHMNMNNEREAPESLPIRSLSQPNGLELCGMTRNDLDDSDSDSVTSHEEATAYYPIFAEVLYNFTAAGPQELGLEKGALIEILRKEIGPWWFGRIKKEDASLVEEILDPELGWFPKDFVRVIHSPETDAFFLRHTDEEEQRHNKDHQHHHHHQDMNEEPHQKSATTDVQLLNESNNTSSSAPCTPVNTSSEDNCNTTVIDKHNVTTIVIESSSPTTAMEKQQQQQQCIIVSDSNVDDDVDVDDDTIMDTAMHHHLPHHGQQPDSTSTTSSHSSQQHSHPAIAANGQTVLSTSQSLNVIMGSADILRISAVKELLDTEVNYVKLLQAICEGYLPAMSKRIDIFSSNSIRLIFSNITAIYKFQRKFLEALRKGIEQNQVAKVFLKMHKGFLCYSTYCNSYPRALIELESYERVKDARTILDNCRESENLAELPLSAHLLAPVQRICRYPLHLAEIIKTSAKAASEKPTYTLQEYEQIDVSQMDIADTTETIDMALEAMKSITEAVNEGKRHSETIARHQASFQNFKGPPLHLHSTRFFLQIDATRQKQNLWNSSCTLFLFDNQLVYCKKDLIKRSHFIYKGRIFLDRCRVVNVRDGKMFGHTIKNSLRIYCEARDKWFDFSFRSANRKHRFLNTLALERQFGGKALYVSEMTGFEYAFEERDYSDQSDYEGVENEQQKIKEYLYESNLASNININNCNTSGESSVPESPAKSFKYSDTLPKKSTQRLETSSAQNTETGSLGRRRLGNWFRKPKSSASTPNQSPTHKSHPPAAHSTGDLQLTGTDIGETYTVLEHSENHSGGVSS